MIYPTKEKLQAYAKQNPFVYVYDTLSYTEIDIPGLYQKFRGPYSFLMESRKQTYNSDTTIIGLPTQERFVFDGKKTMLIKEKKTEILKKKPMLALADLLEERKATAQLPFFTGGAVGHFNYDMISLIETIKLRKKEALDFPLIHLLLSNELIVIDHNQKLIYFIITMESHHYQTAYERAKKRIQELISLYKEVKPYYPKPIPTQAQMHSTFSKDGFEEAVKKAKAYIEAGDIFQVVLSQRMECPYHQDPFTVFTKLREENKAEYVFYIDYNDYVIAGASPELLLQGRGNNIKTIPIAGTRKRGKNKQEDQALMEELLQDPKENAEHMMLVDLGRNDIGKVSKIGSIKVQHPRAIQFNSHVMHMTSEVTGVLDEHKTMIDALCSIFPAGTLSGAPKIRAMEIIDELEPVKREIYGGAIGLIGYQGIFDTCITIRTYVFHKQKVYIQAGAGIVKDSVPEKEYEETMHKANALLEALQKGTIQ